MSDVILVKGAVVYSITLDPSVWVFDERKIDLSMYQPLTESKEKEQEKYLSGTGLQWDKELREGATLPSERRSLAEERKVLEGDFGIHLAHFIENAQPYPEARYIRIHRSEGEPIMITLAEAEQAILQFSKDGKPIRERGPAWFYLPEMLLSGKHPIDNIEVFEVV